MINKYDYADIYPVIGCIARGVLFKRIIFKQYKSDFWKPNINYPPSPYRLRRVGNLGRVVCKFYYPYNPRSDTQQAWRQTFRDAHTNWDSFDIPVKQYYNQVARWKHYEGYNRYISLYLKANYPPMIPFIDNHFISFSNMTDLDKWEGAGTFNLEPLNTSFSTAYPGDPLCLRQIPGNVSGYGMDPAKNVFFQTTLKLSHTTSINAFILAGDHPDNGSHDSFGFKFVNSAVYAYWTKAGTQYTELLSGITVTNINVYKAYIDSTLHKIYFYVNNVLKYTADTNFPTATNGMTFTYSIETTTTTNRILYIIDWFFQCDR